MANLLNITQGFHEAKSLVVANMLCSNWYPAKAPLGAMVEEVLYGTPGIDQITTTGTVQQRNRGAIVKQGVPYYVNGTSLYSLDRSVDANNNETFSTTSLGTIEGTGRVSMASNGTQVMVLVPGGKGYIYNEDAIPTFQEITDADFRANGNPQYVLFIDGYFAVTTDSKKWIISDLNDGLVWNALDFSSAESDPDVIVTAAVVQNQIYVLGSQTTEGFQNIGGSGFPFQRNNVYIDKGCSAPFSIAYSSNTFFMIGAGAKESPAIWQFAGNNYEKVSTNSIDYLLSQYTDIELDQVNGWSYATEGAYFVGWNLPDRTIVYDLTTQKWHERYSEISFSSTRWRVNSIVSAYGRILVGDYIDGKIGSLLSSEYQEYGNDIIRILTTQPFANEGMELVVPMLELTMESGVGNADVSNPQISMAISEDGKKFNYERNRAVGKVGKYNLRQIWRRNGTFSRFTVLKFRLSDAVKPVLIKLEAE